LASDLANDNGTASSKRKDDFAKFGSIEDVLQGLVKDMMENNPEITEYIKNDKEGKGEEKLKDTLKRVILEQYGRSPGE
jgi:hypothetical protein